MLPPSVQIDFSRVPKKLEPSSDGTDYIAYQTNVSGIVGFAGANPDLITFQFYNLSTNFAPGTYFFNTGDDSNFATCEHCIVVYADYDGTKYTKTFYPDIGTITLPASTPIGGPSFHVKWSAVHLVEVTIDPSTFVSTPVPNGLCYNIVSDTIYDGFFDD